MTLSTTQVCRIARVTFRQVDYWARIGLLDQPRRLGSGSFREFTERETLVVFALGRLAAWKIPVSCELARSVAARVREHGLNGQLRDDSGFITINLDALEDPFLARVA